MHSSTMPSWASSRPGAHAYRERAGLTQPPADLSKTSPLERLMRGNFQLGNQTEAALAKRLGAERAHAIRGDGWGGHTELSGCPHTDRGMQTPRARGLAAARPSVPPRSPPS